MAFRPGGRGRAILVWMAMATAVGVPVIAAATSPLLAWRDPVYIAAGISGVIALALLLVQPLAAGGYLPGLSGLQSRRLHRIVGGALVLAVAVHVAALWVTSPPDVIDALLFASPTPFSAWGVIAMWAALASALVAVFRWRLRLSLKAWRRIHIALAVVIVVGSVMHALLIVGTMETLSKVVLCLLVVGATVTVIADRRGRARR